MLILCEGQTQGLDDTILTAEAIHPINFTQSRKKNVLSFLFVNATKIYQFKAKDSKIKDYTMCLGNISKDVTLNNTIKT